MSKAAFTGSVSFGDPLRPADTATTITVVRSDDLTLVSLWSDRDGSTAIGNPFTLTEAGKFQFFADAGNEYDITASDGSSSMTINNYFMETKEQPGRTEAASFTISSSDANQFIETTGLATTITAPTDAAAPDIKQGFIVHGRHAAADTLSFSSNVNVNSDFLKSVPQKGVWSLIKSREEADRWDLFGYLVRV